MQRKTRTSSTRTKTRANSTSSGLSDKALALRKERLRKEEEQKKKMVYMIIIPCAILVVVVLILKAFSGGDKAVKPAPKKVVYKNNYRTSERTPEAARPQMKKILGMVAQARTLIKTATTNQSDDEANEMRSKASKILKEAQQSLLDLSDKHPGSWADGELQRIQTLMYSSKKTSTLNYY